jgi:hypothetical protein
VCLPPLGALVKVATSLELEHRGRPVKLDTPGIKAIKAVKLPWIQEIRSLSLARHPVRYDDAGAVPPFCRSASPKWLVVGRPWRLELRIVRSTSARVAVDNCISRSTESRTVDSWIVDS